jgi:hypothetical protein
LSVETGSQCISTENAVSAYTNRLRWTGYFDPFCKG